MKRLTGVSRQAVIGHPTSIVLAFLRDLDVAAPSPARSRVSAARRVTSVSTSATARAGGRAALDRLRERRYDPVVSDMRMPDGGGEELYRNARAHDAKNGRRFIFITGDTATPRACAFLADSNVPVVEKPFQPRAFANVYRVVMERAASGASA
jgi:CheY-like chemotaxis protein